MVRITMSYQELVDVHAGIDGDFAAKVVIEFVIFARARCVLVEEFGEALRFTCRLAWHGMDALHALLVACDQHHRFCTPHASVP